MDAHGAYGHALAGIYADYRHAMPAKSMYKAISQYEGVV
jgi:hypothetical protein